MLNFLCAFIYFSALILGVLPLEKIIIFSERFPNSGIRAYL